MPFFVGEKMTGGYGGPDIITSCTVDVNKGEIVAILGPNGAGKSTAMKAMLGLLNLKSGKVIIDGKETVYPINREVVTLRGIIPGNYTVNLYMYDNKSLEPVNAKITIEKVNPTLKLVFFDNVILKSKDTELTVVKFRLDSNGNFTHTLTDNEVLTPYGLEGI